MSNVFLILSGLVPFVLVGLGREALAHYRHWRRSREVPFSYYV